jgi:hypothetical protein
LSATTFNDADMLRDSRQRVESDEQDRSQRRHENVRPDVQADLWGDDDDGRPAASGYVRIGG